MVNPTQHRILLRPRLTISTNRARMVWQWQKTLRGVVRRGVVEREMLCRALRQGVSNDTGCDARRRDAYPFYLALELPLDLPPLGDSDIPLG